MTGLTSMKNSNQMKMAEAQIGNFWSPENRIAGRHDCREAWEAKLLENNRIPNVCEQSTLKLIQTLIHVDA